MQFNVEWLKKWVAVDLDAENLADRLTAAGLEVDGIEPVAGDFTGVIVAEIESCEKHPDAGQAILNRLEKGKSEFVKRRAAHFQLEAKINFG